MIYKNEFNNFILPSELLSSSTKLLIYYLANKGTLYADENGDYNHLESTVTIKEVQDLLHVSDRQVFRFFDEMKHFIGLKFNVRKHLYNKGVYCIGLYLLHSLGNETVGIEE